MSARGVRWVGVLILMLAAALPAFAAAPTLAGHWQGVIEIPGQPLQIDLDFSLADDGTWRGDITIPAQGARDLELTGIALEGSRARFAIEGIPGEPTFAGELADTGTAMDGTFTQGGQEFPFRLVAAKDAAAAAGEGLEALRPVIEAALADWKTPGLALAVVVDGKLALAEGYGRRDVEDDLPVTADTLFAIGSSTKAFTTFVMGQLVDQGLLDWDRPLRDFLPGFALQDEYAGAHLTPRDMVSHRSGLPRHDLTWYNAGGLTRADLVERLRWLLPNKELRQVWQYNNLMFLTAGHLIEALTGGTWEDAVRRRIFAPLGMERSNFDVAVSEADADHASPYVEKDDVIHQVAFRPITLMGPAGSINSTAREMASWVQLHLGQGDWDGSPIITAGTLDEMHRPQMVIPGQPREAEISPASYGLGWFVDTWRGHLRVYHGGNIDGFSALVTLFPRDGAGMVVLVNKNGSALPDLVTATVADRVLALEPKDWIGEAATRRDAAEEFNRQGEEAKARFRVEGTSPSRPPAEFAGDYGNPGYGPLEIRAEGDELVMIYNGMTMPLEHWNYDTYNVAEITEEIIPENLRVTFETDERGRVSRLRSPFEPRVDAVEFTRQPERRLSDPEFLIRLAGSYQVPGQAISVSLKGRVLFLQATGQQAFELAPAGDLEFDIKGATGFSVRFTLPEQEPASELILVQPNGVFTATRIEP